MAATDDAAAAAARGAAGGSDRADTTAGSADPAGSQTGGDGLADTAPGSTGLAETANDGGNSAGTVTGGADLTDAAAGSRHAAADTALREVVDRVRAARADGTALDIRGGGSKAFYGHARRGDALDIRGLNGIRSHEPSELVVTVRAGTPLAELEAALAEHGQWLPFEPPHFAASAADGDAGHTAADVDRTAGHAGAAAADGAVPAMVGGDGAARPGGPSVGRIRGSATTVGGMVAAGMAGPARAAVGGVRDYVLGATLVNGRAELVSFGGTVMKNVAGYDVARALAGSMGTLGVIVEVSLKVLPHPAATATLRLEATQAEALQRLNEWAGRPLPLNASAWWDGVLVLRLSGAAAAVRAAQQQLGGQGIDEPLAGDFWRGLRDHADEFFGQARAAVQGGATLWRLSVPATAPPLALPAEPLVEWGGAQRWVCTDAPAAQLREAATAVGGHAVRFRGGDDAVPVWDRPPAAAMRIQQRLKAAFDPDGVFNPGRIYADL